MNERPTPQERKDATAELRKKHQPIFDSLGNPDATFIPKMAHNVRGLEGLHMGFFESELNSGNDVYTEMVSIQVVSEDPERVLYRFRYNPHFREELVCSDQEPNNSSRFYVPMAELETVTAPPKRKVGRPKKNPIQTTDIAVESKPIQAEKTTAIRTVIVDSIEDLPMEQMTIRDYIAIHTGKPVSAKNWINDIVTEEAPF